MPRPISHVIGIDDAPFLPGHRGDVMIVGAIYAATRLEGVVHGKIRRDGVNSTTRIAAMIRQSRFAPQLQLILLQGIAFGGFNVVDLPTLSRETELPVLVVMRKRPDLTAIREALLKKVPGGRRKWRLIEQAGEVESMAGLYVQRCGISPDRAAEVLRRFAVSGRLPEPLRTAHLIAGGMSDLETRQRA
ncbi:MAG: DUF99 family protein [Gammaproteobacteria bacterium]